MYFDLPVTLRSSDGNYVCADRNIGNLLVADRPIAAEWETFTFTDLGNGKVAIKSTNGKYVRAEGGGGQQLVADRDVIGASETFVLGDQGNGNISLQASNGHFVCADRTLNGKVIANRSAVGPWETFAVGLVTGNRPTLFIIGGNNQKVKAEPQPGGLPPGARFSPLKVLLVDTAGKPMLGQKIFFQCLEDKIPGHNWAYGTMTWIGNPMLDATTDSNGIAVTSALANGAVSVNGCFPEVPGRLRVKAVPRDWGLGANEVIFELYAT